MELNLSQQKNLKKININIPNNLNSIKPDIEKLINKNEIITTKYLERIIYTSDLSESIKTKLEQVLSESREFILSSL